ncbi:hypothetical protein BZA77DRAFT_309943 [Pyronema omphalodes]|nr:hypothetical protein BZA77DRAFT_309943 [Pyronema omphalodes]
MKFPFLLSPLLLSPLTLSRPKAPKLQGSPNYNCNFQLPKSPPTHKTPSRPIFSRKICNKISQAKPKPLSILLLTHYRIYDTCAYLIPEVRIFRFVCLMAPGIGVGIWVFLIRLHTGGLQGYGYVGGCWSYYVGES